MKFHYVIWKLNRQETTERGTRKIKKSPIIKTAGWTPLAHLAIPLQKHTMHHDALAHGIYFSLERTEVQFIMHSCASTRSQRRLSFKRLLEILSLHCCRVDSYLLAHSSHLLHQTPSLAKYGQVFFSTNVEGFLLYIYKTGISRHFIHSSLILG